MNTSLCWSVITAVVTLGSGAGVARAAESLKDADRRLDQALASHIAFLADDVIEGRGAGTAGHEIAARYVASQFRQIGLRPCGDTNGWFQTVPLVEARPVSESATLALTIDGRDVALEQNLDFLVSPSFVETEVAVSAPVVFAGYGVKAPELNYSDFAGVDLRGKIAVVLGKAPPRFPSTALAHHSHAREKLRHLVEQGAIGVIHVPTPKDLEDMPWPKLVNRSKFPEMRWARPDGTPADIAPQIRASVRVGPRGLDRLFAKSPKPFPEILAAAARSEAQSFPLNVDARLAIRSEQRRITSVNVLGILPGSDPALKNEALVFTAHLDHLGRGPAVQGDSIYNGAYDNAIGIAMMIEVARSLAASPKPPRRSVVFAAVTAEEKGLVGSDYLAEHLPASAGRPVANINLDMVLVTEPTRSFTVLGVEHSSLRHPVEQAARRFGIELMPDPQPERVVFVRSDQYSFIRRGVPAIFPKVYTRTNAVAATGGLTPGDFNKLHYHQPSDDLSLPRDSASSVRFVRFMADVAQRVLSAEKAPRWNDGDFFGETFGGARSTR